MRKRIPLFGSITNRNSNPSSFSGKDQRFENCYPEFTKNPVTGAMRSRLYKRLGTALTSMGGSGYTGVLGSTVWVGSTSLTSLRVIPFSDGSNIKIFQSTQLGSTIAGYLGAALISETSISGVSTLVFTAQKASDNLLHAWYFPEGGAWTEITDGDFPPNQGTPIGLIGGFAHLDGYAFVMDVKGNIWNSDLNSIANWTATSFIPANAYPDGGSGVAKYGNYIVGFGMRSIEFYRNAGFPSGSPLARVGDGVKRLGCRFGSRAYLNVDDDLFFIGLMEGGGYGVYKLNGFTPVKVSNPAVDKILTEANGMDIAGAFQMHGMTHLLLYGNSVDPQPCYCIDTGIWWYMRTSAGQSGWVSAFGISGNAYFTTPVSNKGVYITNISTPVFQDDGTAFTRLLQTELIDMDSSYTKFLNSIDFVGNVQSVSGNEAISISFDDYANFNSLGTVDFSLPTPRVTQCGSGKRFSVKISGSVNAPSELEAMDIDFEMGTT